MPNYLITIYLKSGVYKQGVRWHSSYDAKQVRSLVEAKAYKTIGKALIDLIDVVPTARTTHDRGEVKTLTPD